jgi:hypothetical protein
MSISRKFRLLAVAVFSASLLLASPAHARPKDPLDPVSRVVKLVKKLFTAIGFDDVTGPTPPHP